MDRIKGAAKRATPLIFILTLTAFVAGCATSTPYQPAGQGRTGYSERQIEGNRFQVSFSGNSLTDRETVEIYLLYRAAQLTRRNGYDYFIVLERETEKSTTYRTTVPFYPHRHLFFYSYYGFGYPYRYGYGAGGSVDTRPRERYTAVAEIVMKRGEKPEDDPAAFDALEVLDNLGPYVVRPET